MTIGALDLIEAGALFWDDPKTHAADLNSSFTDFPLIKLSPETDLFFKEDPMR